MNLISKFSLCVFIFFSGFYVSAQVGINTDSPVTMLDVNGNLSLNASSFALSNGNNNLSGGDHTVFNISGPSGNFNINTIEPLTDADGQLITLVNTTNHIMTLVNNDGVGVNSIFCPNGSNLVLEGIYSTVILQYNKTLQRWVIIKYADQGAYQRVIYSKAGTGDIQTDLTTFSDMGTDMSITFTPKNPVVYVNVSLSGHMYVRGSNNEMAQGYADFRLVKTVGASSTVIAGFTNLVADVDYLAVVTPWNSRMVMQPVSVTPGQATTLKMQWRRDGQNPSILFCMATTLRDISHRSITIFD